MPITQDISCDNQCLQESAMVFYKEENYSFIKSSSSLDKHNPARLPLGIISCPYALFFKRNAGSGSLKRSRHSSLKTFAL